MHQNLILASSSPQRKTLLANLGLPFTIVPSQICEEECAERDPAKRAVLLATQKAQDVSRFHPHAYVLGCDTLVVSDDLTLLEKPIDAVNAQHMLQKLSGTTCIVHSGLCVIAPSSSIHTGLSSTHVTFRVLSDDDIQWWIRTMLWRDRSGGFQIDGLGQLMISRIDGDFTGVVGLPIFLLGDLLTQAGYRLYATAHTEIASQ